MTSNVGYADVITSEDGAALEEGVSKTSSSAINDSNNASCGSDKKQLETKDTAVKCTQCKSAYENLYKELESLKLEISRRDIEIASLREHVTMLETAQNTKNKKRRFGDIGETEMDDIAMQDSANKDIIIQQIREECKQLKAELGKKNTDKHREDAIDMRPMKIVREDQTNQIIKTIEDKLACGLSTIQAKLENILEKRLEENIQQVIPPNKTIGDTYAAAVGNPENLMPATNFRAIMLASKNEELAEETERKRRECNLVIHGKEELPNNEDQKFVDDLIKELCIGNIKIKTVERIGTLVEKKVRPMKIVFSSVADKEKVHSNLRNLQGKTDFNGISIKDDYTYSERMMIKEFAKKAREESLKEGVNSDYVWRVRGNPKNGLTIKRMKKISQDQQMKSSH